MLRPAPHSPPAAESFAARTFTGLELRLGDRSPMLAVQGDVGTSTGYAREPGYPGPAGSAAAEAVSDNKST